MPSGSRSFRSREPRNLPEGPAVAWLAQAPETVLEQALRFGPGAGGHGLSRNRDRVLLASVADLMMQPNEDTAPGPWERSPAEVAELSAGGARLIDVRTAHEHEAARLAGSERIGLEELFERRSELPADQTIIFYCRVGQRSGMAAQAFSEAGYDVHNLSGGITRWIEEGQPIEPVDGYVAEPGEAAAILEAEARDAGS